MRFVSGAGFVIFILKLHLLCHKLIPPNSASLSGTSSSSQRSSPCTSRAHSIAVPPCISSTCRINPTTSAKAITVIFFIIPHLLFPLIYITAYQSCEKDGRGIMRNCEGYKSNSIPMPAAPESASVEAFSYAAIKNLSINNHSWN